MSIASPLRFVARLRKHGYSLVFSIPRAMVNGLALKYGDWVQITERDGVMRVEKIDLGELARLRMGRKYAATGPADQFESSPEPLGQRG